MFRDLIEAIEAARAGVANPQASLQERLAQTKAEIARYRTLWEEALAREVSLVKELWDIKEAWSKERESMSSGKVTPIRTLNEPKTPLPNLD